MNSPAGRGFGTALGILFAALLSGFALPTRAATVTLEFPIGNVLFPGDGTNVTSEFASQGVLFSKHHADLPANFQPSLGVQENLIDQLTFNNLFRLYFVGAEPVVSVTVTLLDSNRHPQTHSLTAFDRAGNILDSSSHAESGLLADPFSLTVIAAGGIDSVVALESPFGAEVLLRVSFSTVPLPPAAASFAAALSVIVCLRRRAR